MELSVRLSPAGSRYLDHASPTQSAEPRGYAPTGRPEDERMITRKLRLFDLACYGSFQALDARTKHWRSRLFYSIRVRLLFMIGASFVPMLIVLVWSGEYNRQRNVDLFESRLLQAADLVAAEQGQILESARQLLTAVALDPELLSSNSKACELYFSRIQRAYKRYLAFIRFNASGSVTCAYPSIRYVMAITDPDLFRVPHPNQNFIVGRYALGQDAGFPILPINYIERDEKGRIAATIASALRLDWLAKYLETATLPAGMSVTLMGPFGWVVASYPDEPFALGSPPSWWNDRIEDARSIEDSERIIQSDGRTIALAQAGGLTVAVSQPAREILVAATHMFWLQLAGGGVVLLIAGGIAWTFSEVAIVRRIRRLGRAVRSLEHGDFQVRYGREREGDELDQLGQAFDRMAGALQHKVDELARSNRDLQQFANVASHDLQEPLRTVSSYCELLRRRYRDELDEEANQFIQFAVDGARRMQLLIKDLLAYARVGSQGLPLAPTSMTDVLQLALANLETMITESGARVIADPLPVVPGDKMLLTQLLQNLVGNSIKYRREAPPEIHVSVRPQGKFWAFAVADNGIGIDPRFATDVFDLFKRLQTRDKSGMGIGLATCKRIVERHGGEIWLDREYREGARFCFTLPRTGTSTRG